MALTDKERAFWEDARTSGHSDDEIAATIKERRGAAEARLPADQITPNELAAAGSSPSALRANLDQRARADKFLGNEDDQGNAFTRFMHRAFPDSRPGAGGGPRYDDPVAHDPIAQAVITATLGAGAGALVAGGAAVGVGRSLASGAANGLTQTVTGGAKDLRDIATGTALGAAFNRPGSPGVAPRLPQSQAEIDAALLSRARAHNLLGTPDYEALPAGAAGTDVLSTRAEQLAAERFAARQAAAGSELGAAEVNTRDALVGHRLNTEPDIQQLQDFRRQRTGQAGPVNAEVDRHLAGIQEQLGLRRNQPPLTLEDTGGVPIPVDREHTFAGQTKVIPFERMGEMVPRGRGGVDPVARLGPSDVEGPLSPTQRIDMRNVGPRTLPSGAPGATAPWETSYAHRDISPPPTASFDDLRAVQAELNSRIKNPAPGYDTAPDTHAASVVSGAMRRFDPRLGPGNFGGALDRYSAEAEQLGRGRELLYGNEGRIAPDTLTRQEAGRSRLARAGTADEVAGQGAFNNEARLRELAQIEPALDLPITQIGARNTLDRRQIRFPLPHSPHPYAAAKAVGQQASNIMFKLRPPEIDAAGMVAGQAARAPSFAPVNPIVAAAADERGKSSRRASLLNMQKEADAREAQRQQYEDMMRMFQEQQQGAAPN